MVDTSAFVGSGAESPVPGSKGRVIVADDDRDTVVTLATLLRAEGYEVREVYRGDAVLYIAREFQPDAILLDIGMPGMTGLDVARKMREQYGRGGPLLIAVTGWVKGADRVLGKIAGFDHYVTKPYEAAKILELLSRRSRRNEERS